MLIFFLYFFNPEIIEKSTVMPRHPRAWQFLLPGDFTLYFLVQVSEAATVIWFGILAN